MPKIDPLAQATARIWAANPKAEEADETLEAALIACGAIGKSDVVVAIDEWADDQGITVVLEDGELEIPFD